MAGSPFVRSSFRELDNIVQFRSHRDAAPPNNTIQLALQSLVVCLDDFDDVILEFGPAHFEPGN